MKKLSLLKGVIFTSLLAISVSGCFGGKNSSSKEDSLELIEVDPYTLSANYRNARIKGMGYSGEQFTEHTQLVGESLKYNYVIEDVKALVVPVDFTDYPVTNFGNTEEIVRRNVEKIMFGGPNDTNWYSLSEYYKSSSFGKCNISGVVAPTWHTEVSSKSINKANTGYSREVVVAIQDYYRSNPIVDLDGNSYNLADFDANKDGFVDSIIMLYTAPITTTGEVWWAFCWSVAGAWGKYNAQGTLEGANRFFWASFNFLYEKTSNTYYTAEEIKNGTAVADAHTMTHEYGHVLSLPDYYITDYSGSDYSGLGGLDMMDYNIGDHNAYSKMCYGWINPRRVSGDKGSVTVTLNSTTKTGDTIIIPAQGEWNDTYMDQYVMIEFLTPEGVAKADGERKFLGSYPMYYSNPGVRITHVDSRLGAFSSTSAGYQFTGYTWATTPPDSKSYVSVAASNTASSSCFPDYKLIELLPSNGKSMKYHTGNAGNNDLYYAGNSFGKNGVWEDFKMNGTTGAKDKEFGYTITVDAIDGYNSATITISHK